ncbi:putative polygalacturonase [Dichanthelium oligosanthes]|uniref:Putative polygalacturonase n=1 Tax=Dichanthelium oligosanthes TaxID=888268 RepID=A0A1E5UTS4_9POAL|nr:putative polygalacturonase [Dichanthelium oligosanthes]
MEGGGDEKRARQHQQPGKRPMCGAGRGVGRRVTVAVALVLAAAALGSARGELRRLRDQAPPGSRPHSVTITEFGAVGDGKTLNTVPFQNAVFYVRSFADKGGAQLYVPKGRWLTGSFNLTSHLTLYLEKGAVIIGAKVHNVTIETSPDAPLTDGIVPDSCSNVCIEDSTISVSHDAISLKSGWDKYGISFGRPTSDIHISRVNLLSSSGAALSFGSEMSGGISDIHVNHLRIHDSYKGISFKTSPGRGGYIEEVAISDVQMEDVHVGIEFTGNCSSHPDDSFDPSELPVINQITMKNLVGTNISVAGVLSGIDGAPFTAICLSNLNFSMAADSASSWSCSKVSGYSEMVFPEPCTELRDPSSSSSICFSLASYSAIAIA